jgi:hypothetical protein
MQERVTMQKAIARSPWSSMTEFEGRYDNPQKESANHIKSKRERSQKMTKMMPT